METDLEAQLLIREQKKECCERVYDVCMIILLVFAFSAVVTVMILISINYFQS
jgi:hypothetical protein